jgi:hypothetical protein
MKAVGHMCCKWLRESTPHIHTDFDSEAKT